MKYNLITNKDTKRSKDRPEKKDIGNIENSLGKV